MTDFRALCAELADKLDELHCNFNISSQSALVSRALAALAEPELEPAAQPVQLEKDDDIIRVHEMASILASIGEIESLEGLAYALLHHPRFTINPR